MNYADDMEKIIEELKMNSVNVLKEIEEVGLDKLDEIHMTSRSTIESISKIFVFSNGQKKEISSALVINHPESLLSVNMIDIDSRNSGHEIEIDFQFKYLDEIVKYMTNEYDIWELNGVEFEEFCSELMELRISFRMDVMNRLYNGSNEFGVGWKNRCLIVNRNEYKLVFDYVKLKLSSIQLNDSSDRIESIIDDHYEPIIQSFSNYLHDNSLAPELHSTINRKLLNSFLSDYPLDVTNRKVQSFFYPIYSPFLKESIITEQQYDSYLKEWVGDYKWKLIYRASEHNYTSSSFHRCCDSFSPTLIIIKSSEGLIFGGYTSRSWYSKSRFHCISLFSHF